MTRRLPNFLYIGPDKAGSTWIFEALSWHPQACMAPAKDIYFFDRYFARGLDWYRANFTGATQGHRVVGEVSHDYLYSSEAARRIKDTLGEDVKLMVCLREPVDRAFSAYLFRVKDGTLKCDFDARAPELAEIVDHGRYFKHLQSYFEAFAREDIYVALFDDLEADSPRFALDLFRFLGVAELAIPDHLAGKKLPAVRPRNLALARLAKQGADLMRGWGLPGVVGSLKRSQTVLDLLYVPYTDGDKPRPAAEQREQFRAVYRDDVCALENMLGIDLRRRWGYP